MEELEHNREVLSEIDKAVRIIWQTPDDIKGKIQQCILTVNAVLKEFIERIPKYEAAGIEIPLDIILQQLSNMQEGLEQEDKILLSDTLEYEIKNTILFYNDILQETGKI